MVSRAPASRDVRAHDVVLASVLTGLGVVLMVANTRAVEADDVRSIAEGSMVHVTASHSWLMVPVFALATVPVLWWRRGVTAVTVAALVAMVAHDVLFGWVTRCGAGLPLAFVLAYLGAASLPRGRAWAHLGLTGLLTLAVLVVDASTGLGPTVLAVPVLLVVFAIGRAVRHRSALSAELEERTAQLRAVREERTALQIADDHADLGRRLDALLRERLDQLTRAAQAGQDLGPDLDSGRARALFDAIETDSRATLDGMRELVGRLRGGDVALVPAPSVAHLDALLARQSAGARLAVSGDPRSLPATVELTAYRIVEHLLDVLTTGEPPAEVTIDFGPGALEIRVAGAVAHPGEVRAAVARARERARFLGGSLDVKVSRGRARAVALLPVLG